MFKSSEHEYNGITLNTDVIEVGSRDYKGWFTKDGLLSKTECYIQRRSV